jgi:HAD superfamily hydrolase (TIGR01484 family)
MSLGGIKPLHAWPLADRQSLVGVLTDIDDTLTTEGAITADALQALTALRAAGLSVMAVTGRPVGWSEPFARAWPVQAIVAENGAVALVREADGRLRKLYQQDAATRDRNFQRLQDVAHQIVQTVPGAQLAQDSAGRETDIAIDHSEFTQLPQACIEQVVAMMRAQGLHATVSSIHINGWIGDHDKLSGARWIVRELLGRDLDAEIARWVYVGDSTNDERMFAHFPNAVGVANIRRFTPVLRHLPTYVSDGERGAGFAQVARAVLDARA